MCRRSQIWCVVLLAAGIGMILSCLFEGWMFRLLIGILLASLGLLLSKY